MTEHPPLEVKVWGPWACFTRPEMKAERVSYPVMTPSAARGVLEAIFWKPEITWKVREIWVLKDINFVSIQRNEVTQKASLSSARKGNTIVAEDARAQRQTLALQDVAYLIKADQQIKPHTKEDPAKWRDQFRRRVNKGQCFHRPYLGCREFSADFGPPEGNEKPVSTDMGIGRMLLDLAYEPDGSGRGIPYFFPARLEKGVLHVPQETPQP
ncbi:MAG: type I-C CRISPR-associated protein Cas5 [Deltaproteobacteria bacterium]|nr:type I-C CRISPR-associated protein Cas5 [Deltaproteobacteria bacterium]